jgi:broad specificity phosphatase PhoE
MANIFIVRHGQDEDNAEGILNGRRDTALTELGRSQATAIADKLSSHTITIICSSPLKRAYETADIIAKQLKINEVRKEPDLIEREFGVMTGKRVVDIPKYSTNNIQGDRVLYFVDPRGSELFPDLLKRGERLLSKIQKTYPNDRVLLVTHGDIGKMIRAAYHNWTWQKALATPYLDNVGILELKSDTDVLE